MLTLLLFRHAKSGQKDSDLADFERPLTDRGRKAAETMGRFIAKENIAIDLVISSPALRTRQTIELALRFAKRSPEVRFDQRIYDASPSRLLEVVSQIEDDRKAVMLVGHNPGMEQLLLLLTGVTDQMPTAAIARIALKTSKWSGAGNKKGTLAWLIRPKELTKL
jgi:phosphohistidine phosphatase